MAHGPEHHLEQAEHSAHAAGPFDRNVAMTMAILAAGLACVAMLAHRGHTETLRLQTQANIKHTEATNAWNYYQAKSIRSHEFQSFLMADMLQGKSSGVPTATRIREYWIGQVDKYEGKGYWEQMSAFLEGKSPERPKRRAGAGSELSALETQATDHVAEAKKLQQASIHVHHNVNWLDFGHLGFELALVLASVSILTKQRGFWLAGIMVAILGAVLALYGLYGLYLAPPHH